MTEEEIKAFEEKVVVLEDWIRNHETLPENIENILVRRFLHSVYGNLEKTKKLIEHHYTIRQRNPNIFRYRDFSAPGIQQMLKVLDVVSLFTMTPENYKITISRLNDFNPDNFNFEDHCRAYTIASDVYFKEVDDLPLKVHAGDIYVYDMNGFSYKHLFKLNFPNLKFLFEYTQEALPSRLKQIHLINVSSLAGRLLAFMKPFMNTHVYNMIKLHAPNSTTLNEFIPQEMMPKEYGGKAGEIRLIKNEWIRRIENDRDYLMNDENWLSRETTRYAD